MPIFDESYKIITAVKVLIKIFCITTIMTFFISCDQKEAAKDKQEITDEKNVVAQNLQQVKVDIDGMTCEIGCARLIQSKLYKADGVTFAKISFEDSSGVITFDQNRINEEGIKAIIERTAGGDLYTVASIHKMDSITENNELQ